MHKKILALIIILTLVLGVTGNVYASQPVDIDDTEGVVTEEMQGNAAPEESPADNSGVQEQPETGEASQEEPAPAVNERAADESDSASDAVDSSESLDHSGKIADRDEEDEDDWDDEDEDDWDDEDEDDWDDEDEDDWDDEDDWEDEDDWDDEDEDDWDDEDDLDDYDYEWFELSHTSISLVIGSGKKLILYDDCYEALPGNTEGLTWETSNKSVATVSNKGYVTAVGFGKATIKARLNGYSWSCKVTVKEPVLSSAKANVACNNKILLIVKNYNGTVKWTSGNKAVATVNSFGEVTAKKPGTAKITAKASGRTLTCTITVPKVTINTKKITLGFKKTYQLKLNNYSGKVNWKSSNTKIATVSGSGKITAKSKAGKATISVKLFGKTYKCVVTVRDTTWDHVIKKYSSFTIGSNSVWYKDRRSTSTDKGDVVIQPFKVTYDDGMIFSFFPEAKTTFAIFDSKGNIVWKKTISKEKHYEIRLGAGKYQLKARTENTKGYYNGYSMRAVRMTAEFMPIELGGFSWYAGNWVQPQFLILNNTGKTIKYINFRVVYYNRVNDQVYNYNGYSYVDHQIIGPFKPWHCEWVTMEAVFYNSAVDHICIGTAEIIFTDGSTRTINVNKNYYRF